jgi:tRNA nucleotidyltransferase (CCA-adding enzyme)
MEGVPKVQPNLIAFTGELADTVEVLELLRTAGGRPFLVGGCVRDALLNLPIKDLDIEVFGLGTRDIENALRKKFGIINVGAAFGVTKLKDRSIDVSVPRRENRTGARHHDFEVQADPTMTAKEAAERRDFTINAISWNPETGEIIDPFNGLNRFKKRSAYAMFLYKFSEDPLRVLRGMQFAARLKFTIAPETIKLCATLNPNDLPPERLFEEWSKLILRGAKPSLGLNFLRECGWTKYFPELHAIIGVESRSDNGIPRAMSGLILSSVWMFLPAERLNDRDEDLIVGLAVLLHDLGKATTTKIEADGRLHAYGHEAESEKLALNFLNQITRETKVVEAVLSLVRWHAQPYELWKTKSSDASVRRLAEKVNRIDRLIRVDSADRQGRGPASLGESPQGKWLLERSQALHVADSAPKSILMGRHLIAMGYKPSDLFSKILYDANEAQLDGVFSDESSALVWLKDYLSKNNL